MGDRAASNYFFVQRIVLGWLALTKMARTTVEGKSLVFVIGETEFVFASLDTQGLTAQSALQLISRLGFYAMQEVCTNYLHKGL